MSDPKNDDNEAGTDATEMGPLGHLSEVEAEIASAAGALDEPEPEPEPEPASVHSWQNDYKATVKALEFDGTEESAENIALHYGPEVKVHITRHLPVMPDVVTLRVEQGSGPLICYQGQWLAKLGKKYAVIDGDDAYSMLEN